MGRTLKGYKKLFDDLKRKDVKRAYFLYGPEEHIKSEFVSELIKRALGEKNRAFNLDILYGDEFDRDVFYDRVSAFPLFTDRRMIIVKKFEALTTPNKDFVLESIEDLPDSIVFVAETSAEKLDTARMKRLKKIADAHGLAFRFQYLSEEEIIQRVQARLSREGFTCEADALDLLVESVGTKLVDLNNELEKIMLGGGERKVIDRRLIGEVVGKYRTESLFSMLDRLGRGDAGDLINRMNRVIDGGEEPIFVMAMLIRRVLLLLEVKALLREKGARARSPQVMAGLLASHTSPYYAGNLIEQAQRVDADVLYNYLDNLRWADSKLKSSSIPGRNVLETALVASRLRKKLALAAN